MPDPAVFELRQYTLHLRQRDVLMEVFDREFIEAQEAVGIAVIGQFRDLDDADRFVWIRGFTDMDSRRVALGAFYGGPVWAAHRDVAAATMIDSDDVLLLRPATDETAFPRHGSARLPAGSADEPGSMVTATTYRLRAPVTAGLRDLIRRIGVLLDDAGSRHIALMETEPAPNTFPALPVREGETVLVLIARYDDEPARAAAHATAMADPCWEQLGRELDRHLATPPHKLRLAPTPRSLLR